MSIIPRYLEGRKPLLGKLPQWAPNPMGIPAPVGAWIMNEGSGGRIYDTSGNGTIASQQKTIGEWKVGGFEFPGDDVNGVYFQGSEAPNLLQEDAFTILVLCSFTTSIATNDGLCAFVGGAGDRIEFFRIGGTSAIRVSIMGNWISATVQSQGGLNDGEIHSCCIVRNSTTSHHLYVDSLLVDSEVATTVPKDNTTTVRIGTYSSTNRNWEGFVFSLYAWDKSLAPEQIAYLHQHPYYAWEIPEVYYVPLIITTPPPTTPIPTTPPPTTPAPTTPSPTTPSPTTPAPTTPAPTTPSPTTPAPTTPAPTTPAPTTVPPTTVPPTTPAPTTPPPTTPTPTTPAPTTPAPTTPTPTTPPPTTPAPTTPSPTTPLPTTPPPTTPSPTTPAPTTPPPTTPSPTTPAPTTPTPTTPSPTTPAPTTPPPTTFPPTTLVPTTPGPTTFVATTLAPTTMVVTLMPTTAPPPPHVALRRGPSNLGFSHRDVWR